MRLSWRWRLAGVLGRLAAVGLTVACVCVAVSAESPAAGAGRDYRPGSPGLGDPVNPKKGNGGYAVEHYDLDLAYDPGTRRLDGVARISARATQDLSRFDLDLRQLTVSRVTVDGREATFRRDGDELVITPAAGLPDRHRFTVEVTYGGVPEPLGGESPYGFVSTEDGAVAVNGLDGASSWFPCNDHPSDKASFTFRVRVPAGLGVVANGELVSNRTHRGTTTFVWRERAELAAYLATVDIGHWNVRTGRTPGGVPSYVAVDPELAGPDPMAFFWDTTAEVVDLWATKFGPYPFKSTGAIAVLAEHDGKQVPVSQEAQSRPVYSQVDSTETIAHELAHQWFGDSVGFTRYDEVWLSEGFATWAAWYWTEHNGGMTAAAQARQYYDQFPADSPFWQVVVSAPERLDQTTGARIYWGGGMVLQFLRERVGDPTFFAILRAWTAEHRHGHGTSEQFAALASRVSGQDLAPYFDAWVFSTGKPPLP